MHCERAFSWGAKPAMYCERFAGGAVKDEAKLLLCTYRGRVRHALQAVAPGKHILHNVYSSDPEGHLRRVERRESTIPHAMNCERSVWERQYEAKLLL